MKGLTKAQERILSAIQRRLQLAEPPPTYRELAEEMGCASTATVRDHLAALERKGYIERGGGRARGIRLLASAPKVIMLPVIGHIVAGTPEGAEELFEGDIAVPVTMTQGKRCFGLRVRGDSMGGVGILDGDLAIIRRQSTAGHGDIVAATFDGETTLKRLEYRGRSAWLVPANKRYRAMQVPLKDITIHGVMVGLLRETGTISGKDATRRSRQLRNPEVR
jgi:repressor LexA